MIRQSSRVPFSNLQEAEDVEDAVGGDGNALTAFKGEGARQVRLR